MYNAASTTTLVTTQFSPIFVETNLSTNTAYGRVVTAIVNGVESACRSGSAVATTYTLAATPGQPQFSNVSFTSFTVTWATNGNPGYTPYEISQTVDQTFATGISTPIAFSANFTANTTTFMNLQPSTTYYFRVRAENGNSLVTAFSVVGDTRTLDAYRRPQGSRERRLACRSISWNWSTVPGATAYRVYEATSTATLIAQVGTNTFNEIGLSTNTAYGRRRVGAHRRQRKPVVGERDDVYAGGRAGSPLSFSAVGSSPIHRQLARWAMAIPERRLTK